MRMTKYLVIICLIHVMYTGLALNNEDDQISCHNLFNSCDVHRFGIEQWGWPDAGRYWGPNVATVLDHLCTRWSTGPFCSIPASQGLRGRIKIQIQVALHGVCWWLNICCWPWYVRQSRCIYVSLWSILLTLCDRWLSCIFGLVCLIELYYYYYWFRSASFGFRGIKLAEWVSDWVCDFSVWASLAMEAPKETKFGTKVALEDEDDAQTSITCIAQTKRVIPHSMIKNNCNIIDCFNNTHQGCHVLANKQYIHA